MPINPLIKIRPIKHSDSAPLAVLLNNKNVWNNLRDLIPFPYSEKDAHIFIDLIIDDSPTRHFCIEFEDRFCGIIGLIEQKDVYRKSAELGYWVGEPYWGKGIATEAVKLITEYGFSSLGLERIYAGVFDYNLGSMKVLEKNGFKKEGVFVKAIYKNEKLYDEHRYYKLNQK